MKVCSGALITLTLCSLMSCVLMASTNKEGGCALALVRDGERYWLEDRGKRMLWHGVNCVLPADGSHGIKYDVRAAYDNDLARWATSAWKRLTNWGFNGAGAWSADELYAVGVPHTRCAWLGGWGAAALVDVFSDEYQQRFDETVARDIIPHANDAGLLGFFCNNEMAWYGEYGWPTDPSCALLYRYMTLPSNAPGKRAVVAFLMKHASNSIEQFNSNWAPEIGAFDELYRHSELMPRTRGAQQLVFEWAGKVAERYFSKVRAALDQHAPGKLLLGARFAGTAPRAVIEACGRYCDVISLNYYRKDGSIDTNFLDNVYALTRKPLMITEFSWRAIENASGNSNTHGADVTVATQADRARCAERYLTALARLPYVIGWDWFQYFDQPPGGRFDGENSNYGLVSIDDKPYREVIAALRRVHARAAGLHAASTHALPASFDADTWPELREIRVPPAAAGTVVKTYTFWRTLPDATTLSVWGDTHAGAQISARVSNNMLHVSAQPAGWGCGCDLPHPALRPGKLASFSVRGAQYLALRALVPRTVSFCLTLNESGAAPIGEQTYQGAHGADGESFISLPVRGVGEWQTYLFTLRDFDINRSYGNQRGNATLDTHALVSVSLLLPGTQPLSEVVIAGVACGAAREAAADAVRGAGDDRRRSQGAESRK